MENWKDVVGFEGLYEVSNTGLVRSVDRIIIDKNDRKMKYKGRLLRLQENLRGYYSVQLGYQYRRELHRLVALAFIPNPDDKKYVNHINGDKKDNRVENLEWVSFEENMRHAYNTGLNQSFGEKHYGSSLKEKDIYFIFENFKPSDAKYGIKPLSEKYGVMRSQIYKILKGQSWKHLNLGIHPYFK